MKIRRRGWIAGVVLVTGLGAIASVRALADRGPSDNSPQVQVAPRENAEASERNEVVSEILAKKSVVRGNREKRAGSSPTNSPPDPRSEAAGAEVAASGVRSGESPSGVMDEFRTALGEIELVGVASREVLEDIFALQNRMNREELAASMKELKLALRNLHRESIPDQFERARK